MAKRVDLIYLEWQQHYRDTELYFDKRGRDECSEPFKQAIERSHYDINKESLTQNDLDKVNAVCFEVPNCRACAVFHALKGVNMSIDNLAAALKEGVIQRRRCIANNPFYTDI